LKKREKESRSAQSERTGKTPTSIVFQKFILPGKGKIPGEKKGVKGGLWLVGGGGGGGQTKKKGVTRSDVKDVKSASRTGGKEKKKRVIFLRGGGGKKVDQVERPHFSA